VAISADEGALLESGSAGPVALHSSGLEPLPHIGRKVGMTVTDGAQQCARLLNATCKVAKAVTERVTCNTLLSEEDDARA
jgi:hypothetical protein